MPELELGQEAAESSDPRSQRVGIQAACLAVLLAIATIASHRTHTQAVVLKTEANDQWSFYQAKKLKSHVLDLGVDLLDSLTARDAMKTAALQNRYKAEIVRYEKDAEAIREKADERNRESELAEQKALRFDLGEGLLEMGLVLASMFFIAKRNVFPVVSAVSGLLGIGLAVSGFLMR